MAVGTSLDSLTGITVTGTYSDGSTANITGYTLSGTIAEGSNTITVSYGELTTTFTVTGIVESIDNILYEWDFTKESMTDTKQGVTLTSSNTTLDSDVLHLTADNSHVSNFGIDLRNKTIELELGECNLDAFTNARWFLLLQQDATANDKNYGIKLDVDTETTGLFLETPNGMFKPNPIISDYSVLSNNTIELRFTEFPGTTPWTQISMLLGGSVIVENKNYRTAEYAVYPSIGYSSARCPHQVTIKKIRIMANE